MTAAHCVPSNQDLEQLMVVTGDQVIIISQSEASIVTINQSEASIQYQVWDLGEPGETRHRVCGVTRHPAYREESVRDRDHCQYVNGTWYIMV